MATGPFILYPGPSVWQLAGAGAAINLRVSAESSSGEVASAAADALKLAGYEGEGIVLAIPSAWCLCAPIKTSGLPARNRRQAMTYRLEEKLPLAAEEIIADFVPCGLADIEAFGVCVQKTTLEPLVEALESSGVAVNTICPAALLALQQMRDEASPALASVDAVLWPSEQADALELFVFRAGTLHAWNVVANQPKELLLHLMVEFRADAGKSRTIAVGNVEPEIRAAVAAQTGLRVIDLEMTDPMEAAIRLAGAILLGKATPWVNLRRDALAVREPLRQIRTPLSWAVLSVVICLLCLCGGMLWRANQYDQMAAHHADGQQSVFHQAFPNEVAPADVLSRLSAEERRLHGLSGDASAPLQPPNGLLALRDLITHLPMGDKPRYRVLEIRLDQNHFSLDGQATTHGDADLIVKSLRRGGMFSVEPPRTEQLAGAANQGDTAEATDNGGKGVSFTITGAITSASGATGRVSE